MQDGFAVEGLRRQGDYKNLEEKKSARMEKGFKNEQQARHSRSKKMRYSWFKRDRRS